MSLLGVHCADISEVVAVCFCHAGTGAEALCGRLARQYVDVERGADLAVAVQSYAAGVLVECRQIASEGGERAAHRHEAGCASQTLLRELECVGGRLCSGQQRQGSRYCCCYKALFHFVLVEKISLLGFMRAESGYDLGGLAMIQVSGGLGFRLRPNGCLRLSGMNLWSFGDRCCPNYGGSCRCLSCCVRGGCSCCNSGSGSGSGSGCCCSCRCCPEAGRR